MRVLNHADLYNFPTIKPEENKPTEIRKLRDTVLRHRFMVGDTTIESPQQAIMINLNLSDKELVDLLKKQLPKIRTAFGLEKDKTQRFKPLDTHSWVQYRVLAYIDISLWAKYNSISLSNSDYADFLNDIEMGQALTLDEDTVRQTIEMHSTKALSNKTLDKLASELLNTED
jgi:hypothetical protein